MRERRGKYGVQCDNLFYFEGCVKESSERKGGDFGGLCQIMRVLKVSLSILQLRKVEVYLQGVRGLNLGFRDFNLLELYRMECKWL